MMKRLFGSRLVRRAGSLLVLIAIGLALVGFFMLDRFVLFPSTHPLDAGRAQRVALTLSSGATLELWAARTGGAVGDVGEPPDAYVLEFTGNATRAEQVAERAADRWAGVRDVEAWAMNFPGYGGSTGPARLSAIGPAALSAYDELSRRARGKPIFVAGNSLGSTAALHVAASRPVAGVIVQNPPALRQMVMSQGWWNLWLLALPARSQVPTALDAPVNAAKATSPAIFITADADTLVLPKFQQLTIDAYAGPKRRLYLKGKGHNDAIDSPAEWAAFREYLGWLWSNRAEVSTRDKSDKGSGD